MTSKTINGRVWTVEHMMYCYTRYNSGQWQVEKVSGAWELRKKNADGSYTVVWNFKTAKAAIESCAVTANQQ